MLSKDNTLSYTHIWTPPIVAETSACPQSVSSIVMQESEQASCGIENQGGSSSALPMPDRLQVDNGVRTDTPPPPNKALDAVTRTSSTHSSACLDLASPPSILVTLSVRGDDWGQVGSASRSKDREDLATMSTGDIPLRTSNTSLSHSSASSLRTLTDTPPRRLFKGSSLRISRTYSDSTEDTVNAGHLRVPSLDTRSHSAPTPPPNNATRKSYLTQTSPTAMSWLTDKSYGITPTFTRFAINAPGVVLPLTVREYQRQQHLKEFENMRKEDVVDDSDARSKLASAVPCSVDRLHGTVHPATCGIRARSLDDNALVPMDSPSFPRIFGNRTQVHVSAAPAQPLQQQYGCTCEAGRPCLCRTTINRRISKIRQKDSEEESSKGVGSRRTATTSVLMKIVSKFNRGTSSTG
ncbi:hypothetical protein JOM56_004090 [Amanita muscaria]